MAAKKSVSTNVDSIEGGVAVLVSSDDSVTVPLSWLPDGVSEGSAIKVRFRLDPEAEEELADRISRLQERMKKR